MPTDDHHVGTDGPCTRGLAARAPLSQLERFRAGSSAAVFARIPESSLSAIGKTRSLGWISAEHERHVTGSIFEVFGPDDGVSYFRWIAGRHVMQAPLLRPVLDQVGRMFGVDPGTLASLAPRPFGLVFRDFGHLTAVDRGLRWAAIELREADPIVFEHPAYGESWRGAFGAIFDLALTEGEVDLTVDARAGLLRYELRW